MSVGGAGVCSPCRPGTYSGATGSGACTACPPGKYTFTRNAISGEYEPIWGATLQAQCTQIPSAAATPLVCIPGTRLMGSTCAACPIGYYCPLFSTVEGSSGQVRACPGGETTAQVGALDASDCTVAGPLLPFNLARCAVSPGDLSKLTALSVRAMTTSLSTRTVYLVSPSAVYRLYLPTNAIEQLAGAEHIFDTEGAAVDAVGGAARFASITALAVDMEGSEASIVVVGDGANVRLIDVYARTVRRMGMGAGEVSAAGGIALRRDAVTRQRWAYVSDPVGHRIMVFSVENPGRAGTLLAGDVSGQSGTQNGYGGSALFSAPMGLAFLERNMAASLILLVADSGNGVIRAIDTSTRMVKTWFTPLDRVQPELSTPISLAVSSQNGIVYVADSGNHRLVAIQMPFMPDVSVKLVTPLVLESISNAGRQYVAVTPYGGVVTGTGNTAGYDQLLVLDGGAHTLEALVQDMRANSVDGGGAIATCHLPCTVGGCRALAGAELCGNGFLNEGEVCDNPNPWSGCDAANCTFKHGYSCLLSQDGGAKCLDPCPTFEYVFTGASYCASDCSALTPRTGFTVDAGCVETDIDECALNTDNCDMVKAECLNTQGAFECKCFSGYFGDGVACREAAFAVYTLIDIPSIPSSTIGTADAITAALMRGLKHAYATELSRFIPEGMQSSVTFASSGRTAAQLAEGFTSFSLDPVYARTYARMELVTLFETVALATEVATAAKTEAAMVAMDAALAQALFAMDDGVNVVQAPRVRPHKASSFASPVIHGGWGMNITGVTYNRTCRLQEPVDEAGGEPASFVPVEPRGGCWMVEMIYLGGQQMAHSDENPNQVVKRGKNVLYIPRIERNPSTMALLVPSQSLTMSSGMYFPCDVSSSSASGTMGIGAAATACCMRVFGASYRAHSALRTFLESPEFNAAVPLDACADPRTGINDTFPFSDIVFEPPSSDSINDLVVGHIEGMPSSEVRLLETLDYTTRTFRVMVVLEEGDLRNHASIVNGVTGVVSHRELLFWCCGCGCCGCCVCCWSNVTTR